MSEGKPKVFISHSWEDNEISRKLADNLRRDGAEVWIDTSRIAGGESLPDAIGKGIEWCDILLLVWSKSAKDSYYVKLEWNCALDNRKRIIPCIIEDEKLPTILTPFLNINFRQFELGYYTLSHDLGLVIKKEEKKALPKETMKHKPKVITPKAKITIFRSKPWHLEKKDLEKMLEKYEFFTKKRHHYSYQTGILPYNEDSNGFKNNFEIQRNGQVVFDHASELMWQQSGSDEAIPFKKTNKWINKLNRMGYAGFTNWRLPTLEEAMSIMEPERKNRLFINPLFDNIQEKIWTADLWGNYLFLVDFYEAFYYIDIWTSYKMNHVRAVCSEHYSVE